jgi:hypothetical protein
MPLPTLPGGGYAICRSRESGSRMRLTRERRYNPGQQSGARKRRRQRPAPVVVSEGPAAGGGVWSTAVDPGVPLGPGLLATWLVFHGPHVRTASARTNAAAIMASVPPLIEPFLLSRMRFSTLGDRRTPLSS